MSIIQIRIALLAAALIFCGLTWQIVTNGTLAVWDDAVAIRVSQNMSQSALKVSQAVSQMGGPFVVGPMVIAALIVLVVCAERRAAIAVLIAVAGSALSMQIVKALVDRPRPGVALDLAVSGASFPSATTVLAAATFGSYAAWIVPRFAPARACVPLQLLCLFLPIAVAAARVLVSEHFVTDVLAGLALGVFWVLLTLLVLRRPKAARLQTPLNPT